MFYWVSPNYMCNVSIASLNNNLRVLAGMSVVKHTDVNVLSRLIDGQGHDLYNVTHQLIHVNI